MTQLTKKADIRKNLVIHGGGFAEQGDNYVCEYSLYGKEKIFTAGPILMAKLLQDNGFIDGYTVISGEVYMKYTPLDEPQRTDFLEDYMHSFSQYEAMIFITEYETRRANKAEIKSEFEKAKSRFA